MFTSFVCIVNKRLDEWVPEERMDMNKLEPPRKDQKTPKKEPIKLGSGPSSPEREIILMVCSNILKYLQSIRHKLLCWFTESY